MKGVVRIAGKTSREFNMKKGIKQRDSLSLLLFIILMDQIPNQCKRRTLRCKIGNYRLSPVYVQSLIYADDIVLIAKSKTDLQIVVEEWVNTIRDY